MKNKMDYQLAKELKDAGYWDYKYPFEVADSQIEAFALVGFEIKGTHKIDGKYYLLPTLSELVEACGISEFEKLINDSIFTDVEILVKWYAQSFSGKLGEGVTPSEAVARLWLSLNKKS